VDGQAPATLPQGKTSSIHRTEGRVGLNAGLSGFGGAEVACWPLIPKFAGSNVAESVGFLKGDKNPQHTFLWKGSKIFGPMSQICGM
jgi:hypothetical protein